MRFITIQVQKGKIHIQDGPLPVVNGVITPISRVKNMCPIIRRFIVFFLTLFITTRGPPCTTVINIFIINGVIASINGRK